MESDNRKKSEFRQIILGYYRNNRRNFPWRSTTDPYAILVSEMMLQQTQTERVLVKYVKWMEHFPSAAALSAASFSEVLAEWNGLGYNRRARYLQNACIQVMSDYGGIFPKTAEKLQKLPGLGPYTSRAVSTFAYNNPEIFIETNIRSVFIFFFFADRNDSVSDRELMPLIAQTLYRENPREWYYALMDYGSELKKKTVNPGRKSAHYSKQSKFEGSLRQARGAVLRQLTKTGGRLLLAEIAEAENLEYERISAAASSLEKEGFVVISDDGCGLV
jgi:A/G-specific adenine glycosylase